MQQQRTRWPELVAHRGNAADFPENTLPALRSALEAGIPWVEIDVQVSADGVPFVLHDARLERTTRSCGDLRRLTAAELGEVDAGEPGRFGEAFRGTPLPRLAGFVDLLSRHPAAGAFVELKRASLAHHGRADCVERMVEVLGGLRPRCVILSFDAEAAALARVHSPGPVGWVIERFDPPSLAQLEALRPDFVFYDHLKVPAGLATLPGGPWRWAAYEVADAGSALQEARRGADLLETMAPLRLRAALDAVAEGGG